MKYRLFRITSLIGLSGCIVFSILILFQALGFVSTPSFYAQSVEKSQSAKAQGYLIDQAITLSHSPLIRIESGWVEFHNSKKTTNDAAISSGKLSDQQIELLIGPPLKSLKLNEAVISIDLGVPKGGAKAASIGSFLKKSALSNIQVNNSKILFKALNASSHRFDIPTGELTLDMEDGEIEGKGQIFIAGITRDFTFFAQDQLKDDKGIKRTKFDFDVESNNLSTAFSGFFYQHVGLNLLGDLKVNMKAPFHFSPPNKGNNSDTKELALAGTLNWSFTKGGMLSDGEFSLFGNEATGNLGLRFNNARPQVVGSLAFDKIDAQHIVQNLLVMPQRTSMDQTKQKDLNDVLLTLLGAEIWSIKDIDADLRLSTQKLTVGDVQLEDCAFSLFQKNGTVIFDMAESRLLGGQATGHVKIDTNYPKPRWHINASLKQTDVERLTSLFGDEKPLEGMAHLKMNFTSFGDKQEELYQNMFGDIELSMPEGGEVKLDFDRIATAKPRTDLEGWAQITSSGNDFNSLSLKGKFSKGAIVTDKFEIETKQYQFVGGGSFHLKKNNLNWQIAALETIQNDEKSDKDTETETTSYMISCHKIDGPFHAPFIMSLTINKLRSDTDICPKVSELKILEQNSRDVVRSGNSG